MISANPYQYLRACAWCGPIILVIALLFWGVLGQNIPPYSAALDAETFAAQFREHAYSIRIGMDAIVMSGVLYMLWGLAISRVMEVVETGNRMLSSMQMWGAGLTTVIFIIPPSIWLAATFRAETTSPEILQMLYDLGWIMFDMTVTVTSAQFIAFGLCFLGDRRRVPLIPKWVSWLGIYIAVSFLLLAFMPFFKSGPFSRSGLINYFVEFGLFFLFMILASYYLLKAIGRLELEHARLQVKV